MEEDSKQKTIIIRDSPEATKKQKQDINQSESEATEKRKQVILQMSPPPKTERPVVVVVDLPPSLSSTYTYNVDAFPYHPGLSTAGIFSSSSSDAVPFCFLRPYPPLNLPLPSFFDIPTPFAVLSSSSGLLLIRSSSTYHVLNPFLHTPASHRQLPPPPQPHPSSTPAVLSVDTSATDDNPDPVFHVVCAVEDQPYDPNCGRTYTFDTYSSNHGNWSSFYEPHAMLLGPRRILPSTGVSNGRGMAFWLTDAPTAVVKVTVAEEDARLLGIPHDWIHPSSCLQLGRLSDACIGLVAASAINVAVFRFALDEYWFRHGFLNVVKREGEVGEVRSDVAVVCPEPQERPAVMRFERDVAMWIDGRMVVLGIDWENRSTAVQEVHEMPAWTRGPETVWDAVPYVCMEMEAEDFPVFEDLEDSDDDA